MSCMLLWSTYVSLTTCVVIKVTLCVLFCICVINAEMKGENVLTNYYILEMRFLKYFSSKISSLPTAYKVIDLYCRNAFKNHGGGNPMQPLG